MKQLKPYQKIFIFGAMIFTAVSPIVVGAITTTPTGPDAAGITNPLKWDDVGSLLTAVVDGVTQIGFYVIIVAIIYSGFLFVKARGNEKGISDAKKAFLYTIIGAAILLGARVLSEVIKGTVEQIRSGPGSGSETIK